MISPFLPRRRNLDDHRHRLLHGRADLAAGGKRRTTRIRHFLEFMLASAYSGPVVSLPIRMVALALPALLMAPVGLPMKLPSVPHPALVGTIGLPTIAMTANVEQPSARTEAAPSFA